MAWRKCLLQLVSQCHSLLETLPLSVLGSAQSGMWGDKHRRTCRPDMDQQKLFIWVKTCRYWSVNWVLCRLEIINVWRPLTSRTSSAQSGCTRSMVGVKTAPQCSETAPVLRPFTFTPLNFVVTARREDLTLTCVLTCAEDCEENFNLTWSAANQEGWRSTSTRVNNTLTTVLLLPAWPNSSDEMRCSVYKEGSLVASRKWHSDTCRFAFLFSS